MFPVNPETGNDFNSIKVRLKRNYDLISRHVDTFQFHKGTIKTYIHVRIKLKMFIISIP